MCIKITLIFLITLFIILLKLYEFSIVSSATLLLGIIWNWAKTVKGLLVKFVGPTNKQDSRHLVKSGPAEESIECQMQGGLFPPLVTGARRSPLRFLKF